MSSALLDPFKDKELFPILYNVSYFYWGDWQKKKYFSSLKDKTPAHCLIAMKGNKSIGLLNSDKLVKISEEFFYEYFRRPSLLLKKQKEFAAVKKTVDLIYRRHTSAYLQGQNISRLIPLIKKVKDLSWNLNGRVWFCVYPLSADFFSSFPNINKIWNKATTPICDSFDKMQRLHILRLSVAGIPWPEIVESCQYFFSSYHHTPSLREVEKKLRIDGYPLTMSQAIKELKKEAILKIQKEKEFFIWYKKLSASEKKIVSYIQAVIRFRDQRKEVFNKSFAVMYRIASEVFQRAGISTDLIPFAGVSEISRGVKYLKRIKKDLEKRKKGFFIYYPYAGSEQKGQINYDKLKNDILSFYQRRISSNPSNNLAGQCGSPGKVKGRVRIIIYQSDFKKFKQGEILISGMTRPEFMPLIKKARGIITDEGGITCHAAIVSRELKKPCVIGTKNATRVLKDGDMVEIDADNGVVKIIKKK